MQASRYTAVFEGGVLVATVKTQALLIAAANLRPKIYDLIVGFEAAPADEITKFRFSRTTTVGTTSAVVAQQLDPDGRPPLSTAGENASVEPTFTGAADLLLFPVHRRATFRWIAAPGSEITIPATANNGMGLKSIISDGTPQVNVTMLFVE